MRRKLCSILCGVMVVSLLSGCGIEAGFKVNKNGKITTSKSYTYFTEEEIGDMAELGDLDKSVMKKVKLNGKTYYRVASDEDSMSASEESLGVSMTDTLKDYVTATECILDLSEDTEANSSSGAEDISMDQLNEMLGTDDITSLIDFYNFSVTFPYKVSITNGEVQSDGKTVVFDIMKLYKKSSTTAYAFTPKSKKIIQLAKPNGTTLSSKAYVNSKKVKVVTYDKLNSVSVNGKTQKTKSVTLAKDGKYTVKVKTVNSSKSYTVYRDTVSPAVTGAKNGKSYSSAVTLTYKDSSSGVKSATLDGKSFKSGKKVSAKGSHTLKVTDKAGNTTTVKFTIK